MKRKLSFLLLATLALSSCTLYSSRLNGGQDQVNAFIDTFHEDPELAYTTQVSDYFRSTVPQDAFVEEASQGFLSHITSFKSYEQGRDVEFLSYTSGKTSDSTYGDFLLDDQSSYPGEIVWIKEKQHYLIHGIHTVNYEFTKDLLGLFEAVKAGRPLTNPLIEKMRLKEAKAMDFGKFIYFSEQKEINLEVLLTDEDGTERNAIMIYRFEDGEWVPSLLE